MFCARCGEQIPDATETCPLCGREASIHIDPPAPLPTVPHPQSTALTLPVIVGPSGVSGWLLFFCVSLTILAPLPMLMRAPSGWRYLFEDLRMFYGMAVGAALWLKRPISLLLLRIYFILAAATAVLVVLNTVATTLRTHGSLFLVPGFAGALEYMGTILLWFAYFRKSVRVRNTYGSNI